LISALEASALSLEVTIQELFGMAEMTELKSHSFLPNTSQPREWGETPWQIKFKVAPAQLPPEVNVAIIGAGFTGLSAAACLCRLNTNMSVAVFEACTVGCGSSGHTGGLALAETAAGDLPGLGDVLSGFANILSELEVSADLKLTGVWELSRSESGSMISPICWADSGELRAVHEVPGGTIDPGKLITGLACAAARKGAVIFEHTPVERLIFGDPILLTVSGTQVRAKQVLIATNAQSLELSGLTGAAQPKFTLALATEPLSAAQIDTLGMASGKPFYTIDLPYLWGRVDGGRLIFGSGLVHLSEWRELLSLNVSRGKASELLGDLSRRVHALHPVLKGVRFTYRWGGPILIADHWRPVFRRHQQSSRAIVLGAYSGHGVALSVYLGRWAAEAMLGRRDLPEWPDE
jgi:glycine/D-amino acid oxidase-like deaminating enzyme